MDKKVYILCLLMAMSSMAWAGTKLAPDCYHFVTVSGSIGGAGMLNNSGSIKPSAGVVPEAGIGYRLFYNDFIFQTGLGVQYMYLSKRLPKVEMSLNMLDTEDDAFVLKANLHDGKDVTQSVNALLPVLLGYEHHRFYFLLGGELAYSVYATASSNALLTTNASYGKYMDDFEDMPNHQLYVDKQTTSGKQTLNLNATVYAHAEVGWRLGDVDRYKGMNIYQKNYRLYLSLYADYGVMNIHRNTANGSMASYRQTDTGVQFFVMPTMLSSEMLNVKVNPLSVGVKFTASFQMPSGKDWMIYNGQNNYRRVRNKSQVVNF